MKEEGVSKYETWKDFKIAISQVFGEADSNFTIVNYLPLNDPGRTLQWTSSPAYLT
jgi:hypothetical protein